MMIPTGIKRLDALLDGGIPDGSAVLVHGPSFMGKELLVHRTILGNLARGTPVIHIITNATAQEVRAELSRLEPGYDAAEAAGLIHFVDTFSTSVGAQDSFGQATYLDSAIDLNGLSVAVNRIQKDIVGTHDRHLIVIDSLSTLIAHGSAQTTFRFLQTFLGRTRQVGATTLALMDVGMHSEPEMQMFRHLSTGMVLLRDNQGKPQIRVQGMGAPAGQSWVEYRFDGKTFEITGSFAAGRIR